MASTIKFEDEILKLLFQTTTIPTIAQNVTATPATEFFVSLHTDDPTRSSDPLQTSVEVAYTGYIRQAVARTAVGWKVENGKVFPEDIIEFPEVADVVGTPKQATFFGIGTEDTGSGKIMFSGKLTPAISLANGTNPRIDNNPPASRFPDDWA